jgi:nicotinate-nucleotide pyrophosphorylase (carboxylating)
VIAGLDVATEAFRQLDPEATIRVITATARRASLEWRSPRFRSGRGAAHRRAHGAQFHAADDRRRHADASVRGCGRGRITILDTRKTTPLMRVLEKYAVRAGGGVNHRFGLADGILIKDNHVRLAGGVSNAVRACGRRSRRWPSKSRRSA